MADRMPPPGGKKPGLMIAVGVGKPSGGGRMPPPGGAGRPQPGSDAPGTDEPEPEGPKHTEAEAHPVKANEHCKDCRNWNEMNGSCSEVEGTWDAEDACVKYFEPTGSGDPDEASEGEEDPSMQGSSQGAGQ